MRVAIVHDDLTQRGGAERVVLSLGRLFPDAPIFTTVFDAEHTFPEFASLDVRTTFLQRAPKRNRRALLPLYPAAIRSIDLRGYDAVISSTSRFAHGVQVPDGVHVTYCHNPARFLYQRDEYFGKGGPAGPRARAALAPVLPVLRRWDLAASRRPDVYVANSRIVAERIETLYGRHARVVHPPVDLTRFPRLAEHPGEYHLVVSRLLPYKRIDVAVEACTRTGRRLVVVGRGPAEAGLRAVAGPTVEFRSDITDAALSDLLAGCRSLIQPGLEDLGFAPIEANACGRPAVAYAAGGALETVRDTETGVLVPAQSVEHFVAALDTVERTRWDPMRLRAHAEGFGEARFHAQLLDVLAERGIQSPTDDARGLANTSWPNSGSATTTSSPVS